MVGGDILKYSSKCLIELKNLKNMKLAVLKKHRSLPENLSTEFRIVQEGIIGTDEESISEKEIKTPSEPIKERQRSDSGFQTHSTHPPSGQPMIHHGSDDADHEVKIKIDDNAQE